MPRPFRVNYNADVSSIYSITKGEDFSVYIKKRGVHNRNLERNNIVKFLDLIIEEEGLDSVAKDIGVSTIYLRYIRNGQKPISKKFFDKFVNWLGRSYATQRRLW